MSYALRLVLQLVLVAVSVLLGSYLADNFRLIPDWLLYLPEVDFSTADILTNLKVFLACLLYTSPSPRDKRQSRMPSSA